jgi:hypothetical protein
MNRARCEREGEVVSELRVGSLSAELKGHLRGCVSCAETERVARALLRSAAGMRAELEVPAAEVVWRRARARSRELALKRAARPLILMRVFSFVCVVVSAVWLSHGFWNGLPEYWEQMSGLGLMATRAASLGIGFAVLSVGVASCYLLWESRRSGGVVPSA